MVRDGMRRAKAEVENDRRDANEARENGLSGC